MQAVLDICKRKEKWLSLLKSPNKVGYGDKRIDADKILEEIVELNSECVEACPSTKQEIHRGLGRWFKQFYSEIVLRTLLLNIMVHIYRHTVCFVLLIQ